MATQMKIKRQLNTSTKNKDSVDAELAAAFPDVDPGFEPLGSRIVVQIRSPKETSKLILLTDEAKEAELWNTQIAKVRAIGPVAFKNRTNLTTWPEGEWFKVGDYVRIPKWNQDKWIVEIEDGKPDAMGRVGKKQVLFMMVNDLDILAKKIGNPLEVKAYI